MARVYNPMPGTKISLQAQSLAAQFFGTGSDRDQIPATNGTIEKFSKLSPYCLAMETDDESGDLLSWALFIPTQKKIGYDFLNGLITERELFDSTAPAKVYDALYVCSVFTLPKHRQKGIAKRLIVETIDIFLKEHPIELVFSWPYSNEGRLLAKKVSETLGVKVMLREIPRQVVGS